MVIHNADGLVYSMTHLLPGTSQTVYIHVNSSGIDYTAQVAEGTTVLGSTTIPITSSAAVYAVTFTPATTVAQLYILQPDTTGGNIFLAGADVPHHVDTIENGVSYVCSDDNYRYGYGSGQMKVNEIAGIGNHYHALYWDYDPRTGRRWNLDPRPTFGISIYSTFNNSPIANSDRLGDTTDYTAKLDGTIEKKPTTDNFDRILIENKNKQIELVAQLPKNSSGLLQLTSTNFESQDPNSSFSFTVKDGNEYRSYIRGDAAAALFGAFSETNAKDLTVVGFSLANGSSPSPSVSHKEGKNGDLRYLNSDQSGRQTLVTESGLDVGRQSNLNNSLYKFGWKDMISEHLKNGTLLPHTTSAKGRGIHSDHTNHLHLQGFKPQIQIIKAP